MRARKYKTIVIAGAIAALVVILYASLGRVICFAAAKFSGLDISYERIEKWSFGEFVFDGLKVTDPKRGVGFRASRARIGPIRDYAFPDHATLDFELNDIHLIMRREARPEAYDSLAGLVSVPFAERWMYKEISGSATIFKGGVTLKDTKAVSGDIRLDLSGTFRRDNKIDMAMVISFSDNLSAKIPEELSSVVLTEKTGGWKSLSVNLTGDFNAPSIQISSKLFRLNIRNSLRV